MVDTLEQIATEITSSAADEFTPEVHVTSKTGEPAYTKKGTFRKKRGIVDGDSQVFIAPETSKPLYDEMGMVMATTITSSCTMFLGKEWIAAENETTAMSTAWSKYFESAGWSEFPPWVMLAMVHAGYVAKRIQMPETKSRLQRFTDRLQRFMDRLRGRHARTDLRNDEQREDNISDKSSA